LKPTYFIMVLIVMAAIIPFVVFMLAPMPLREFTAYDCVWWLRYDQQIHREHLNDPPGPEGTPASHQQWIDDFEQIISRIERLPCKLTKAECIELLYKAQSTHAGWNSTDYVTAKWHYDWYIVYQNIITYMEKER
jgi:hypothetical protein